MDWLNNLIKSNPITALILPTTVSGFNFFANLFTALGDGQIDGNELHQLLSSADGFQLIILVLILFALRDKKV